MHRAKLNPGASATARRVQRAIPTTRLERDAAFDRWVDDFDDMLSGLDAFIVDEVEHDHRRRHRHGPSPRRGAAA